MATAKTTKAAPKAQFSSSTGKLAEKLRQIATEAKHAADPREPAAQLAAALADHFEAQ